jgi:hypothetical protein
MLPGSPPGGSPKRCIGLDGGHDGHTLEVTDAETGALLEFVSAAFGQPCANPADPDAVTPVVPPDGLAPESLPKIHIGSVRLFTPDGVLRIEGVTDEHGQFVETIRPMPVALANQMLDLWEWALAAPDIRRRGRKPGHERLTAEEQTIARRARTLRAARTPRLSWKQTLAVLEADYHKRFTPKAIRRLMQRLADEEQAG